jgi:CheY-like chemotaxis protein/DNA-directed RNA polymerase subunit RPC12/RpoP
MLLKCPSCGARIRLNTPEFKDKKVRYLCQECEQIVSLDLELDEIRTSSSSPLPDTYSQTHRILVADDAPSFTEIAKQILAEAGYDVIIAHDGVEALKKITEERPDAILLDLFMPRMSGFEVLKTLRTKSGYRSARNIPVLVTSAVYNPAEMQLLHDLGANGFITKEAIPESLVYRIKLLLTRATLVN